MLAYPKCRLTRTTIDGLRAEVVLDLALAAGVPALISGDADLLALKNPLHPLVLIRSSAAFQIWLDGR